MSIATTSHAQWSAGAFVGLGHLSQRQESKSPDKYLSVSGVEPVQPLKMAGVYGQLATKGKWPLLAGLQLGYQHYIQAHGVYDYLVVTPYVGTRLFKNLEIAVGPELTALLHVGQSTIGYRSYPVEFITGYNVKATYWLGRFGLEGGYSHQNTAFTQEAYPTATTFNFYNRYVYGALKYRLTQ